MPYTLRIIMPSTGDMKLKKQQDGGIIDLEPRFFGGESMGPHFELLDEDGKSVSFSRLKLKASGKLELKRGDE